MEHATPKPVVLVFPFDLMSHYLRCLQLAQGIRDDFDVRFAQSRRYGDRVREAGFATFDCKSFDADFVMARARQFDFSWLNESDIARVLLSQIRAIRALRPVAVLGDTAPTLKMAAALTRTPYVALMNGYMTKHYVEVRDIPENHPAARFRDKVSSRVFRFLLQVGERQAFKEIQKAFNHVRRRYGLPEQNSYQDELEGDHNLICDDETIFPQQPLPANYRHVGPLYYAGTQEECELKAFLQSGTRRILVNLGSSGDSRKLVLLNQPEFHSYRIIVAGGGNELHGPHVAKRPFVNCSALLDDVDLVICHGGNGAIYQSLAHGVPVLCMSSIFEQIWNLQRIEAMGLGASLAGIASAGELKSVIETWAAHKNSSIFLNIKRRIDVEATTQRFSSFWRETFPLSNADSPRSRNAHEKAGIL